MLFSSLSKCFVSNKASNIDRTLFFSSQLLIFEDEKRLLFISLSGILYVDFFIFLVIFRLILSFSTGS